MNFWRSVVLRIVGWSLATTLAYFVVSLLAGHSITLLAPVFLLLLFYVDIVGLDGGAVFGLCRLFGSKASFDAHVYYVSWWKPPLFFLQLLGFFSFALFGQGFELIFFGVLVELFMFYKTFKSVHRLSSPGSAALTLVLAVTILVFFVSPQALSLFVDAFKAVIKIAPLFPRS